MSRFRVLQFNMQFGQCWDDADPDNAPIRLDRTIAEIKTHDADVVFLQELEKAQPGGAQLTPPPNYERLRAELTGYDSCFGYPRQDSRELPFGIGLAIFSKTPLRAVSRVDLESPPIEFSFNGNRTTPTDRLLIRAETTLGGREVQLFNTHLLAFFMLGSTSIENPGQRQKVAELIAESKGPALLAGDFNVRRHQLLAAQFAEKGFKTVQDEMITWRRQPFVLDHIFYNAPLRPVSHQVVPTLASDHHALVADFEL